MADGPDEAYEPGRAPGSPGTAERYSASSEGPRNLLLRRLRPSELSLLLTHLEPRPVAALELLGDAERPLTHAYFPESAVISVVRRMRDGSIIETHTVGREGMAGVSALLGDPGSPASMVLGQVPGACYRVPLDTLRRLLPELPSLAALLPRLALALLDHVQQAVACNSLHTVEERCARWLLLSHDAVGRDEFLLTHEVLAQMLAVRRAGVTVAAGSLQRRGLITYTRGRVSIVDRPRLERAACECYTTIRAHAARLLGHDAGPVN